MENILEFLFLFLPLIICFILFIPSVKFLSYLFELFAKAYNDLINTIERGYNNEEVIKK